MSVMCDGCKKEMSSVEPKWGCDCGNCDGKEYCLQCTFECDRCKKFNYIGHKKKLLPTDMDEGMCWTCHKHIKSVKTFTDLTTEDLRYLISMIHMDVLLTYENIKLNTEEIILILYGIIMAKDKLK